MGLIMICITVVIVAAVRSLFTVRISASASPIHRMFVPVAGSITCGQPVLAEGRCEALKVAHVLLSPACRLQQQSLLLQLLLMLLMLRMQPPRPLQKPVSAHVLLLLPLPCICP